MLGLGVVSKLLNDNGLRTSVGDLVVKTLRADVELLQNSADLSYRLMRCGLQAGLPAADAKENSLEDAAEVVKDLIQVNVGYYSTLVDLNLAFTSRLLNAVGSESVSPSAANSSRQTSATVPEMKLVAKVGEHLRVPFRVENNRAETTVVSFHLTPFTRAGQSEAIHAEASFDPPEITLDPYQEVQIFLSLPVTPMFSPAGVYKATLAVEGMDAMRIEITLEVIASA